MVEETRSVGVPAECRRSTASLCRAPKSDRDLPAEAGKKELDITPAKAGNPDEEGHRRAADVDDRKKNLVEVKALLSESPHDFPQRSV